MKPSKLYEALHALIGELGDLSDFNESLGGFSSARIGLAAGRHWTDE